MKTRLAILILALSLALALTGCSEGGSDTSGGSRSTFNGGSEGLDIQFMDNAPPAEVFDSVDSTFDISVRLQNKGEDDVGDMDGTAGEAEVTISGIDPSDFSLTTQTQPVAFPLLGTRLDPQGRVIPGTTANVDFVDLHFARKLSGNVLFNIRADVCYHYQSKAIAKLCFRKNLLAPPKDSDVCDATRSLSPENSGSPVHVEDFAQSAVGPARLSFSFKVHHVGTGKVFTPAGDSGVMCDDSSYSNEDKVQITIPAVDGATITCPSLEAGQSGENGGVVRLFGGEKIVTCTMEITEPGDYEKSIDILTDFNYRKSAKTPILVRHIEEG
ncbi:MAG: hypothetical protein ABIC95_05815 [archaeon]